MSILKYLRPKDGLPDPHGSLSSVVSPRAITRANQEIEAVLANDTSKKRGPYKK